MANILMLARSPQKKDPVKKTFTRSKLLSVRYIVP